MIFHENRLPADDSHEIPCLICYFQKGGKIWNCRLLQIIGGVLRVNDKFTILYKCAVNFRYISYSLDDFTFPFPVTAIVQITNMQKYNMCGAGGDRGPDPLPPPLENHMFYGFLYKVAFRPSRKKLDPLENVAPRLENVGTPLKPCKIIVFFEINHW